jgi:hypothetical protein
VPPEVVRDALLCGAEGVSLCQDVTAMNVRLRYSVVSEQLDMAVAYPSSMSRTFIRT